MARIIPHIQSIYNNILSVKEYSWPILGSISHKYWDFHYTYNDNSDNSKKINVTEGFRNILEINVIAPFAFYYGHETGSENYIDYAMRVLENARPESNGIVKWWVRYKKAPLDAGQSQALIELKTQYCDHKNCVICNIGKSIILKQ